MIDDYKRAISAYQFQVKRYHTWMNYYSIFEGALFVALYSVNRSKLGDLVYMLIPILGFIVSLCWLGSIIGHRCWMNSWLDIVKEIERKDQNIKNKIYKTYSGNEKEFLSTQVITQIFIIIVVISWAIIICSFLFIISNECFWCPIVGLIGEIILIIIINKIYKDENSCIHSILKDMDKLSLFLLVMIIPLSSCDNVNKKENKYQENIEVNTLENENKEIEEVKKSAVSLDEGIMITAINELLYNPDLLGYVINGSSIARTLSNNPMKIQKWIDNTRNSEYPFVFIKAKIYQLYPLENGCQITTNSNSLSRELIFYVANDEELYEMNRGDEVYLWALPMKAGTYRCYFEIAFVSKYIHSLIPKIMEFSNLFIKRVTTSSKQDANKFTSEFLRMIDHSELEINDNLNMIDKAVAKHYDAYKFVYDKYYSEEKEGISVIDRSKGFMIINIE